MNRIDFSPAPVVGFALGVDGPYVIILVPFCLITIRVKNIRHGF